MSILWAILIGFLVGLLARALMPGPNPMGFIITTLLGIAGAVVGKFVGQGLGMYREDQPAGFFMSLVGAIIILFLYNHFVRQKVEGPK